MTCTLVILIKVFQKSISQAYGGKAGGGKGSNNPDISLHLLSGKITFPCLNMVRKVPKAGQVFLGKLWKYSIS